jgi:hypothetical protein
MGGPTIAELYAEDMLRQEAAAKQGPSAPLVSQAPDPTPTYGPLASGLSNPAPAVRDLGELDSPPQSGAVLGRTAPVPPAQQDAVSRWIAQQANGKSEHPLFQVPSIRNNSQPIAPPPVSNEPLGPVERPGTAMPNIGPGKVNAAPVTTSTPAGLGNRYANGGGEGGPSAPGDINWARAGVGGTATIPAHEVAVVSKGRQDELVKAEDKEVEAVEDQKKAIKGSGEAAAEAKRQEAIGLRGVAKAAEDAGVDAKLRAQTAADESKAYRKHIDDFSKKVAEEKIDPQRMYHDASTARNITWTLAKCFGAIGQAFLHTSTNQVADQIEAEVAADVAAQRANHEIHRERLQDMNNAYAHALQVTAHTEDAERLATGYALESAKHEAAALAASAQSDVAVKRNEELQAQLSERQAQLGQKKVEKGIAMNPLVHARTVATGPDLKAIGKRAEEYQLKMAALGKDVSPDEAFQVALKYETGRNPIPGQPLVHGAKSEPGGNKQEKQASIDEVNKQYKDLLKSPVIDKLGFMPAIANAGGFQRAMPESSAILPQVTSLNIAMDSYAGKLLKDNEGRIPPPIVEQLHQFHVKFGDTPEFARQQIEASRQYVNSLARAGGEKAPEPYAGPPPSFSK